MKAPYAVQITQLDDGSYLVQVGCKTLSYDEDNLTGLTGDIARYFTERETMIKEFAEKYGWNLNEATAPPADYTEAVARTSLVGRRY